MNLFRRFRRKVGEQLSLLRSVGSAWSQFWRRGSSFAQAEVDYDLARRLYMNSDTDYTLGAGFCRRIIDGAVEFVGTPRASSDNADLDDWLNTSIYEWWADEIAQLMRNAMRDSKVVVRLVPYDWRGDPLISAEDDDRIKLEVIEPERVRVYYNVENAEIVERVLIKHSVPFYTEQIGEAGAWGEPHEEVHEITEVLTREDVSYYDHADARWIDEWAHSNQWGVVPILEIYNEWDATLGRGQSDLEASFAFIKAFHDVMYQSLQAHRYHSIPKVKFKIADIDMFMRNNFPQSYDAETGQFKGTVDWQGKEILFLEAEEDADFLEARSILGDSKSLLEFIFDCICTASETPSWVLLRTEQGTSGQKPQDAVAFVKRIERKRVNFATALRRMFKIALVMSDRPPVQVKLAWDAVRPEDEAAYMQALQQLMMALEIAAQRRIISDETYRSAIRPYIPPMKNPQLEEREAKANYEPAATMPGTSTNGQGPSGNVPVSARPVGGANE